MVNLEKTSTSTKLAGVACARFSKFDRYGSPLMNADGQPSKFLEPRVALISVNERSLVVGHSRIAAVLAITTADSRNGGEQRIAILDFPLGPIFWRVGCIAVFHAVHVIAPSRDQYQKRWLPSVALGVCRLARSTAAYRRSQVATHSRHNRDPIRCASS